jgi:hypothetical protein
MSYRTDEVQRIASIKPPPPSVGVTPLIFGSSGILSIRFPIIAILDAASPILYFQFLQVSILTVL